MRLIDADKLLEEIKELERSPWYNDTRENPTVYYTRKDTMDVVADLCIRKAETVDETAPKLKACPFCGGKARLFANDGVRVICTKCKAQTNATMDTATDAHRFNSVRAVISRWNRRTEDEKAEWHQQ